MKVALLNFQRSRWICLLALLITIVLGLATRNTSFAWPVFVSVHAGDALWSVALYFGLAWIFPRLPGVPLWAAALGLSFCVELSQLLSWEWLVLLRETLAGQLLLGQGFQWLDFPRYTCGALAAFALDAVYLRYLQLSGLSCSQHGVATD